MVGVIVVTHGLLGKYLLDAAQTILGPQEQCAHIAVEGSVEVETLMTELKRAVKHVDSGNGVLILTDMFGGTPSNISLSLLQTNKIDVLTGANLPMLLRILGMRDQNLSELVLDAKNAAIQGIVAAGEILTRKIKGA
ncbi:MAG: PTS sugar transporter subunit IIA [Desulfomicrobium sp.]|jgi:PTS system mannose-specific IIA component|nr:PTS sugar transporter subunit IIA [Desulfomicrobium sp.]NLV97242.1 PTS sugar transporter subunit IIA [Desulfovibrionales bacterium]